MPLANPSEILEVLADPEKAKLAYGDAIAAAVRRFGGLEGLADWLWKEFEAADPGSRDRFNVLRLLMQGVKDTGESSGEDQVDPVQMEAHLRKLLAKQEEDEDGRVS